VLGDLTVLDFDDLLNVLALDPFSGLHSKRKKGGRQTHKAQGFTGAGEGAGETEGRQTHRLRSLRVRVKVRVKRGEDRHIGSGVCGCG